MVRRLPHVVALAAVVLLSVPTAAVAAYSAQLETPENGIVSGARQVEIRISRDLTDAVVTGLQVRLAAGGELQPTTCVRDCDRRDRNPVFAFDLDPRSGAPFASEALANGPLEVEGIVSREVGGDRSVGTVALTLRVPGSAVGGLAATVEDRTVRLAWRRAPEPDIEGYRVERCGGACDASARWESLDSVSPSASSFADQPGVGEHSYRIVTVRDGGDGGDRTIETVSSPVTTTLEPAATASGNGNGSGNGSGASGDGGGTGADEDGGADAPGPARTSDPEDVRPDGPRREVRESRSRPGSAPSLSVERDEAGSPDVPDVAEVFEDELDYSEVDPEVPSTDRETPELDADDEVLLGAPGPGDDTFLGALTDPNRVAVPIAGGLLMTAIGLHLWRWLRFPLA